MTRHVCVVITARPSYSRIKSALLHIKRDSRCRLSIVAAGSLLLDKYGEAVQVLEEDGLDIAERVFMLVEGSNRSNMVKTTGLGAIELATTFQNLRPDLVITVADRYETMATAIAASYMHIPLLHVQGGEVSGSIDEKVRHAITKLADLHCVSTQRAAENVVRLGESPSAVHVTGCPSIDLAADVAANPKLDFDPIVRYGGVGSPVDLSGQYLVVLQHPVTSESEVARKHVGATFEAVAGLGVPALWFWPNPDAGTDETSKGIRAHREMCSDAPIRFMKSMRPSDFLRIANGASCLIGNSSVGIREGSYLGIPVVNIGTRQSGRERASNVIDVSYGREAIAEAVRYQLTSPRPEPSTLYGDGHAGERIAKVAACAPLSVEKRLVFHGRGSPVT